MAQRTARTVAFCLLAFLPSRAWPQANGPSLRKDTQLWSEALAFHSLRQGVDLVLIGAFRLGRDARHPVYERGAAGLSFKLGRHITLSPLYSYFATQPLAGQENRENRISLEGVIGVPRGRWAITDRNVIERRFRDPKDSTRYKNFVRVQRQIKVANVSLGLFVADEVVYDWSFNAWVRQRLFLGGAKSLNKKVSLDIYYVKQNGNHLAAGDLRAVGMTLRAFF